MGSGCSSSNGGGVGPSGIGGAAGAAEFGGTSGQGATVGEATLARAVDRDRLAPAVPRDRREDGQIAAATGEQPLARVLAKYDRVGVVHRDEPSHELDVRFELVLRREQGRRDDDGVEMAERNVGSVERGGEAVGAFEIESCVPHVLAGRVTLRQIRGAAREVLVAHAE
jgi:hypothetical protein